MKKKPEEIFYESVTGMIKNLLLENPNEFTENPFDFKERAEYILERIEETKHLIDL